MKMFIKILNALGLYTKSQVDLHGFSVMSYAAKHNQDNVLLLADIEKDFQRKLQINRDGITDLVERIEEYARISGNTDLTFILQDWIKDFTNVK